MKLPRSVPDKNQHKIAVDTVRNPAKSFLGGMSEADAIKILKTKFEYSDAEIKKLQEIKLTESQIKRIKPLLTKLVNEVKQQLKEETKQLDSNELKIIVQFVNSLGAVPHLSTSTNDQFIKQKEREISGIRIEIMNYVEENSAYKFLGKSPNGWKLVKK